jgi:hypothetical protein
MAAQQSIDVVVAHYDEDLQWLDKVKDHSRVSATVYHKGNDPPPGAILLENVGRESHTYLTHIVRNYGRLADLTLFLQGNPVDHAPHDVPLTEHIALLAASAARYGCSTNLAWGVEPGFRPTVAGVATPNEQNETFGTWFERVLGRPMPEQRASRAEPLLWYVGGIMGMRRDRLTSRPRAFYEGLLRELDWHVNPAQGHYFERAWYYIFDACSAEREHAALVRAVLGFATRPGATPCSTRPSR